MNRKDAAAGLIFILIGAWFALEALGLRLGSALNMGPGYFPLLLALVLIGLGLAIVASGIGRDNEPLGIVAWRGLFFILMAPVVFGVTVRGLGLVPALLLLVLCASFASRRVTPAMAGGLAAGLTVFCVAIFHYGIGVPLPLFGRWVGF